MASGSNSFTSLCTPAMVYVVLAIISMLMMLGTASIMTIIAKLFFVALWTWFLNFLCKKNLTGVAWFLVLLPFILIALILLFAIDVMTQTSKQQQPQQMQTTQQMQPMH